MGLGTSPLSFLSVAFCLCVSPQLATAQAALPETFDIPAKLGGGIKVDKLHEGDRVTFEVTSDVIGDGRVLIPRKAKLQGTLHPRPGGIALLVDSGTWGSTTVALNAGFAGRVEWDILVTSGPPSNTSYGNGAGGGSFSRGGAPAMDNVARTKETGGLPRSSDSSKYDYSRAVGADASYGSRVETLPRDHIPSGTTVVLRHLSADFNPSLLLTIDGPTLQKVRETRAAAAKGDAAAEFLLASLYFDGSILRPDHTKAAEWFLKAADQGLLAAQTDLGILYFQGDGVPKDDVTAYMWLWLATIGGEKRAATPLTALEDRMTAEQLTAARQRIVAWKQAHPEARR